MGRKQGWESGDSSPPQQSPWLCPKQFTECGQGVQFYSAKLIPLNPHSPAWLRTVVPRLAFSTRRESEVPGSIAAGPAAPWLWVEGVCFPALCCLGLCLLPGPLKGEGNRLALELGEGKRVLVEEALPTPPPPTHTHTWCHQEVTSSTQR